MKEKVWEFLCHNDWLLMFIPMVIMTILFYFAKLIFWAIMFTVIMGLFGLTELASYLMTERTISQAFQNFMQQNKVFGWSIIVSMWCFWSALILHLLTTKGK